MNLPHHRKYHWHLIWKEWRRVVLMAIGACALAVLILMGEMYLLEHNDRLSAELSHKSLIADVHKLATLGAPGYVKNDWTENTTSVYVRKIK